jgi:hypothetical protein
MKKLILVAALVTLAAAPAQADHGRSHHGKWHHHHATAMSYPDTVTLEGKEYKVCKAGMMDDCVNPRQAGLGFGNRPTDDYHPHDMDQHP